MRIERTRNAARNLVFGGLLKAYQILLPFVMRTAMIYWLGVEYLGLSSLFTSLLSVLSLAELGVGTAMVYSMYRPIAEDDTGTICALLRLYRLYYRLIGLAIGLLGLALMPLLPRLIQGEIPPDLDLYALYLISLATTVLSYWLLAYRGSLLTAHQRTDVASKITLATSTLTYAVQLLVLWAWGSYYAYLITAMVTGVLNNLLTAWVAKRMYPRYRPAGRLDRDQVARINRRIRDLFTAKVGAVVVYSADTIVVSAFLGLTVLAVYQNYYFIVSAIMGVFAILFNACVAGVGNSIVVESGEKNYHDLRTFTFITGWLAGFCACCLLCLYQPFMEVWVGKELTLGFGAVVCFSAYFFVQEINTLLNMYKDAAGIWHEDRFRPLVTALANLALNLLLVQVWGIYGVVLSTVVATLGVGMPWLLHNLFTTLFDRRELGDYLRLLLRWTAVTAVGAAAALGLCVLTPLTGWAAIVVRLAICCLVPNLWFLLVSRRMPEFRRAAELANRMTGGRLGWLARLTGI